MGGSGGMFGSSKQKPAGAFKMTKDAQLAEAEAINRQRAIANGTTPSIGQMAFNQNIDQAGQQAMAMAASQRGASNPALAFRTAQLGNQQMGLQAAQHGAIMQEQERRQADQFLQQTAAGQRGIALQSATANQQADQSKSNAQMGMVAGMGGAAMGMASDENVKENIKEEDNVGKAISEFMEMNKAYSYDYKDSKHGGKDKIGVMAQDLEKSKIGKTMVDEDAEGVKRVDPTKAIGALLAATAELHKEIKDLKKKA